MPKSVIRGSLAAARSCGGLISRLAYARAGQQGVNTRELLKQAGLTVADIKDPNARFSVAGQIRFVELVADAIGDPELGVHLAKDFDLRRLNFLYYVPASADTLGSALLRLERYSGLVNESVLFKVNKGKSVRISMEYAGVARHTDRQQASFFITALIRLCRHLAARNLKPLHVRLAHRRRFANNDLDKFAGVAIERSASADEIVFAPTIWTLPVTGTDPYLHELLVRSCEEALSRRETKASPLRTQVENVAAVLLPHGKARLTIVAARLGMSPRTLTRRLAETGLSFSGVVRELRLALSHRYLADRELPISQVAWLLGYSEISGFTHAFRRWTGMTPSQARDRDSQPA